MAIRTTAFDSSVPSSSSIASVSQASVTASSITARMLRSAFFSSSRGHSSSMSDRSLSFWVTGPAHGEIRQMPLAAPGAGELIVQALFSGVSRGTESLVFNGKVPPSEYTRMRAPFQEGDFPTPVKYGYCMVGRVLRGPAEYQG